MVQVWWFVFGSSSYNRGFFLPCFIQDLMCISFNSSENLYCEETNQLSNCWIDMHIDKDKENWPYLKTNLLN